MQIRRRTVTVRGSGKIYRKRERFKFMQLNTLLFHVQENVAHISLNRPKAANTVSMDLAKELMDVVIQCDDDPQIRGVLISGEGSMFCGGGDINEFYEKEENISRHLREITTYLHAAVSYIARMDAPVVAAVHGSAAGAGLSLVCASDIVFAAEDTKFTMAYTRLGLTPDGGSTYSLPRLVGTKRALELILTNRVLSSQEALDWGIVNRIVQKGDLIKEARAMAVQLAKGPTKAFGTSKRLIIAGLTESLEGQLKNENECIADMGKTYDGREGIDAFMKKRPPKFKGR